MGKADLHIHTLASDGRMTPGDVVRTAHKYKLEIISITDHDTIRGFQEALQTADKLGIELISGAEITANFKKRECHLLAYCFDPEHPQMRKLLDTHQRSRLERAKWIIEQLSKEGFELDIDEVKAEANGLTVGRPHIAKVLINKGYVSSFKAAFIRYLSDDSLGAIYNEYYSHYQVIKTIKAAGGAVVIAHPGNLYSESELQALVEAGVDGIEFIHPSHNYKLQTRIEEFAEKYNLLTTGGSDFHGGNEEHQKFFGIVTINTKHVRRLMRMTSQRKKIISQP